MIGGSFCFRGVIYMLIHCLFVYFFVLSDNRTTRSWMPKCQQKNCSNDLALFFSLLGAQFSTNFLDNLHMTSQDVFNYSCEISRDFNSKVFHKSQNSQTLERFFESLYKKRYFPSPYFLLRQLLYFQ